MKIPLKNENANKFEFYKEEVKMVTNNFKHSKMLVGLLGILTVLAFVGFQCAGITEPVAESVDTIPPVITVVGYTNKQTTNVVLGDDFVIPEATATDNVDNPVAVTINDNGYDNDVTNTYNVLYTAEDRAGKYSTFAITIIVGYSNGQTTNIVDPLDMTPPVITVVGYSNGQMTNIIVLDGFVIPIATAIDDVDGSVAVIIHDGGYNNNIINTCTVTYKAKDNNNNVSTFTLIIISDAFALNLPRISIHTEGSLPITSKNNYRKGTFEIARSGQENVVINGRIKGRGHSTWGLSKKPYQIKFNDKEEVLGMPRDKKWILLANYIDKTMLRNEVSFHLSRLSRLEYTPQSKFVEVFINDKYVGVYQITQKVEESRNRVDIGDDGYLLEIDQLSYIDAGDVYFETTNHLFVRTDGGGPNTIRFNIKEPDIELGDDKYKLIKNHIQLIENVLVGDNFADPVEGYTKYLDVNSFVDWYLVNEITKSPDKHSWSSIYLNYIPGGKLKMGPVWDFDNCCGNHGTLRRVFAGPTEFHIKNSPWFSRLFEDPSFVTKVKDRFNYFYSNRSAIQEKINSNALYLDEAQERNFVVWPILGVSVWPNTVEFDTYDEGITYLKNWLNQRLDWLNTAISNL